MHLPTRKPFQFSLKTLLIFVSICVVMFALFRILYDRTFGMFEVAQDAYALEQGVALLKAYMIDNNGA
jgi:hypothetical protein